MRMRATAHEFLVAMQQANARSVHRGALLNGAEGRHARNRSALIGCRGNSGEHRCVGCRRGPATAQRNPVPGVMIFGSRKGMQGCVRAKLPAGVTWDTLADAFTPEFPPPIFLSPAEYRPRRTTPMDQRGETP